MASRKEQKEALRKERLEREQQAAQAAARKRLIGIVVAAILALGIVGAVIAVALGGGDGGGGGGNGEGGGAQIEYPDGGELPEQREAGLQPAARAAGCELESVTAEGAGEHTGDPEEVIEYETEPPALGAHYQEWPEDDIYEEAPPLSHVVHTLEHGRILVWLNPELPEDDLAQFKALYDEDPYHVIMLPRAELEEPFAVSAWVGQDGGHILRCDEVNDRSWDAIRAFKEQYRDKAPEFVP